jgi:hypothetical protein
MERFDTLAALHNASTPMLTSEHLDTEEAGSGRHLNSLYSVDNGAGAPCGCSPNRHPWL